MPASIFHNAQRQQPEPPKSTLKASMVSATSNTKPRPPTPRMMQYICYKAMSLPDSCRMPASQGSSERYSLRGRQVPARCVAHRSLALPLGISSMATFLIRIPVDVQANKSGLLVRVP